MHDFLKLGSVAGPVIQANKRLTFEGDLRSRGLLYFTTQKTSVRTELADSMVTLHWGGKVLRDGNFACRIHPAAQNVMGKQ